MDSKLPFRTRAAAAGHGLYRPEGRMFVPKTLHQADLYYQKRDAVAAAKIDNKLPFHVRLAAAGHVLRDLAERALIPKSLHQATLYYQKRDAAIDDQQYGCYHKSHACHTCRELRKYRPFHVFDAQLEFPGMREQGLMACCELPTNRVKWVKRQSSPVTREPVLHANTTEFVPAVSPSPSEDCRDSGYISDQSRVEQQGDSAPIGSLVGANETNSYSRSSQHEEVVHALPGHLGIVNGSGDGRAQAPHILAEPRRTKSMCKVRVTSISPSVTSRDGVYALDDGNARQHEYASSFLLYPVTVHGSGTVFIRISNSPCVQTGPRRTKSMFELGREEDGQTIGGTAHHENQVVV